LYDTDSRGEGGERFWRNLTRGGKEKKRRQPVRKRRKKRVQGRGGQRGRLDSKHENKKNNVKGENGRGRNTNAKAK